MDRVRVVLGGEHSLIARMRVPRPRLALQLTSTGTASAAQNPLGGSMAERTTVQTPRYGWVNALLLVARVTRTDEFLDLFCHDVACR
jgi:hypothetical protein